jgi:hypothetical protein
MSISREQLARIEDLAPVLLTISEKEIKADVKNPESALRKHVYLERSGAFEAWYAPFDWINDRADVVIVGVTPGLQQGLESLLALRSAFLDTHDSFQAAEAAKQAASFKGTMRKLGARLMDHFGLHELFGLETTLDLFGSARHRAHYTSAVRYPIFENGKNYSGDGRILTDPLLKRFVDTHLADELARFRNAWIVPFGPNASAAVESVSDRAGLDPERILGGILHPSGQQWNRYNVQLELVDEAKVQATRGGPEVVRRSEALKAKVSRHLGRPYSPPPLPSNVEGKTARTPTVRNITANIISRNGRGSNNRAEGRIDGERSIVRVWDTNIANNHLYVGPVLSFFPSEVIGGSNRDSAAPRKIEVEFSTGGKIVTDIDGAKKLFRVRNRQHREFIETLRHGDEIEIRRIGLYQYSVRKIDDPHQGS